MLIEKLVQAAGVSGYEKEISNLIKKTIVATKKATSSKLTITTNKDVNGNLLVKVTPNSFKSNVDYKKILFVAHMDEVGLMVTNIESNGLLKFRPIGGIDPAVLVSKQVLIGDKKTPGVIGAKPIHLQKTTERNNPLTYEQLYIDIGANKKEDAEKVVEIGQYVIFATKYKQLTDKVVVGKAMDDRIGCQILLDIIKRDLQYPIYCLFSTQEEIGLRGAVTGAWDLDPDFIIVVEGTAANDVVEIKEHQHVTRLGQGVVFTVMDNAIIINPKLNNWLIKIAKDYKINYQIKEAATGANDAGTLHLLKKGILTSIISVPVRYIHSPNSMINLTDYEQTRELSFAIIDEIQKGGFPL